MSEGMNKKERLLHIAFEWLAEVYPCCLYEWLDKHGRRGISHIEEQINQNFRNEGRVDDLKSLLREYWTCYMHAIGEFERRQDM